MCIVRLPEIPAMNRDGIRKAALGGIALGMLAACQSYTPVRVVEPESDCARLRSSYPSDYGLMMFRDSAAAVESIPWCFPKTAGFGVIGYNVNIPIPRPGTLSISITDVRPPVAFAAASMEGTCASSTSDTVVRLGSGTRWSMPVSSGNYCISLVTVGKAAGDVWFTLTVERP